MARKKWSELSRGERGLIGGASVVQVVLLIAALVDIRRRPAERIRGAKRVWTVAAFVNFLGPIAYFVFGRKR
ncbi:PLD nuclease N-terminal domain-containing protein [Spongiactinospora sp. TRM90649]|uniref:PLD nuclease N-terminal domain-containing protein n=1 Tax=Spongiactinospora sp. TRM90649 TaxID=3031114 RepID=UPI0023F6ED41|nr:PLD nuclease N-terminal domain-containing protein [Spongiactinospora sp. TRM90649]MDF5751854.1 PLD nuclease N-terminal domain-containing protein [Spongiactinospora sp. TRM90649]